MKRIECEALKPGDTFEYTYVKWGYLYKVVDGKLYLNVNADVFKKWSEDVPGNIAKANANWPSIKDKAPSSL